MPDARDQQRRIRSAVALFAGVAASALAYSVIAAILPLAAEDLLGSPRWSGLPSALATAGVAVGTSWLASHIAGGHRSALAWGYAGAAAAAALASFGAFRGTFALVIAAVFLYGVGFSANRLSRYAAADLFEPEKRSAAIGWNVWAAVIGSVLGPLLLGAIERWSRAAGMTSTSGPFAVSALALVLAALVVKLGYAPPSRRPSHGRGAAPGSVEGSPHGVRLASVALITGQVVMVLVMTMTPIHLRHSGHGLETVGVVYAAHTAGMYALSPLAGYLSGHWGRPSTIVASCTALASSCVVAVFADAASGWLALALFLLGFGWSLGFVAASALLTESAPIARRVRLQGRVDSAVWSGSAAAGLLSGVLLSATGFRVLAGLGVLVALIPLGSVWAPSEARATGL